MCCEENWAEHQSIRNDHNQEAREAQRLIQRSSLLAGAAGGAFPPRCFPQVQGESAGSDLRRAMLDKHMSWQPSSLMVVCGNWEKAQVSSFVRRLAWRKEPWIRSGSVKRFLFVFSLEPQSRVGRAQIMVLEDPGLNPGSVVSGKS